MVICADPTLTKIMLEVSLAHWMSRITLASQRTQFIMLSDHLLAINAGICLLEFSLEFVEFGTYIRCH